MRKIRDVLRYRHTTDLSLEAITGALRVAKGVVAKYLKVAASAGLSWPLPDDLDDRALERRLYPRPPVGRAAAQVEPDYARVHQELKKKGVWNRKMFRAKAAMVAISPDVWHDLVAEVRGKELTVFIDAKQVLQYTTLSGDAPKTSIGFGVGGNGKTVLATWYDDVNFEPLEAGK
jgi:hypothetical protein